MSVPKSKRATYKKEYKSLALRLCEKVIWLTTETSLIPENLYVQSDRLVYCAFEIYSNIIQFEYAIDKKNEFINSAKGYLEEFDSILYFLLHKRDTTIKITTIQDIIDICNKLKIELQ